MFRFLLVPVLLSVVSVLTGCTQGTSVPVAQKVAKVPHYHYIPDDGPYTPDEADFGIRVKEAADYCKSQGLNTEVALLADLGLHSGSYRLFVVRLADGVVRYRGLVAHGSGKRGLEPGIREYSNTSGSLLSALGKYKTGAPYQGQFGLAYKLHGLEATNSKAYSRAIVLHAHECVPEQPFSGILCQSWGCPTVSAGFLQQLARIIDASPLPLLLWVYDSASMPE
jgi:hypothetical protein